MMEPFVRNDVYSPTVKCTSCAADIELAAVAEHNCNTATSAGNVNDPYIRAFADGGHEYTSYAQQAYPDQYDHRAVAPPVSRNNRPILPKLDSSMTGRSGLRPSEAASIAHDLGLPSPVGASNSGRRSPHRSRSRKASKPRPPSPDGPISQDCAFPPFPMKPKRPTAEKDGNNHKPQSVNRTTSAKKPHHSSNQSNSSSIYSSVSGFGKRRTSNTSSSQRSRQGTMDDSMSWPSTAPSSPHQSIFTTLSKEQSIDQAQQVPPLISSHSSTPSEPNSSMSMLPSTPLWPNEAAESVPRIVQSPNSELGWTPTEHSIPEEQMHEVESSGGNTATLDEDTALEKMHLSQQSRTSLDMFDNPPKELLHKTKRPAALLHIPSHTGNDPSMPLSARAPPPPAASSSLTRTLTNIFSRKRSQTSGSKALSPPAFDSPRMRALAPDPPQRPQRGEDLWDPADSANKSTEDLSSSHSIQHDHTPLAHENASPTMTTSAIENHDSRSGADTEPNQKPQFEFDFAGQRPPDSSNVNGLEGFEKEDIRDPNITSNSQNFDPIHTEEDLRRASIDSASSYGSIGFSHQSKSSRSTLPVSSEIGRKPTMLPDLDQNEASLEQVELAVPPRLRLNDLVPDSPTDPCYQAGKLTPVSDTGVTHGSYNVALQMSPTEITPPERQPREEPKIVRPITPAGVRGRCRGCSDLIVTGQKSVASADGRLSGKYHKDCFVCQTCQSPFATADFYVFNDQPYCGHHYHVLNDTLCAGCGKGIEGQYCETFDVTGNSSKKFHSKCLQCATCKVQLSEDYFEFHGRIYCERDAFRAASGATGGPRNPYDTVPSRPSPLVREYISSGEPGLKGRFPERRTTRLIMT